MRQPFFSVICTCWTFRDVSGHPAPMENACPNNLYAFLCLFLVKLDPNEHLLGSGLHQTACSCVQMEAAASEFLAVIQLCQILPRFRYFLPASTKLHGGRRVNLFCYGPTNDAMPSDGAPFICRVPDESSHCEKLRVEGKAAYKALQVSHL